MPCQPSEYYVRNGDTSSIFVTVDYIDTNIYPISLKCYKATSALSITSTQYKYEFIHDSSTCESSPFKDNILIYKGKGVYYITEHTFKLVQFNVMSHNFVASARSKIYIYTSNQQI